MFTTYFSDESGARVDRPGFSQETEVTVTFAEHHGRTTATIRQTGLAAEQGELQGWTDALERLQAHLAAR